MCPVTAGGVEWLLGSRTLGSNQETAAICIRTVTMAIGGEGGRGGEGEREVSQYTNSSMELISCTRTLL